MICPRRPAALLAGFLIPLGLVLGLTGCAGESQPIARVGSTALTRADFMAAAGGAGEQYPPDAEPAKAMLIEDMVRRRLLVLAATQRGIFDDTLVVNYRRLKEEELLVQALGSHLAPTGVSVSEAEIRQLYAWRDSAARVQIIYAFTQQQCESAAREARAGADFTELADRINPTGAIPPGGDIGMQAPGNLTSPLDEHVRTAAPGTIVGPLESPGQGWFVMKIGERLANPQGSLDDMRRQLGDMIRQRKHRASIYRAVDRLRAEYALRTLPGAGQILFAHLNAPAEQAPVYTAEELARPLARWESAGETRTYNFAEALADLNITGRDKPNALVLPSIEQWILAETGRRIQILDARRRRLDADPAFRRQIDETVNNYVLESLYSIEVMEKATAEPSDAIEVYARNRNRFEKLEGITAQVIDFPDSAAAASFTAHSGLGADLHAAAAMVPGAPPVRDLNVRFPNPDPDWSRLESSLAAMGEGDAIGPFPAAGTWRIVLVVLKQIRVTPFESLDAESRMRLEQEGLELARERRLMTWVDELRREFPVSVDTARVRKLPWPVPKPGT
ncbi:MAG: peptidylprolyl isomerase [Candidatus Eisenbacteria bacterium]